MENVAYIVSADTDSRRVVTPKIVWYCASLLFMFVAVAAAGPLMLTPVGAQTVYQAAVGLTADISTEAYLGRGLLVLRGIVPRASMPLV